jgi:hypothetical protein
MEGKLTICEFAKAIDNNTQYDAIGAGISLITVPQFPAPITFSILIESQFTLGEAGKDHPFEVKTIDDDGKAAGPSILGAIRVAPAPAGPTYAAFNVQLTTKKPVKLNFSLLINGMEMDAVGLRVEERKKEKEVT